MKKYSAEYAKPSKKVKGFESFELEREEDGKSVFKKRLRHSYLRKAKARKAKVSSPAVRKENMTRRTANRIILMLTMELGQFLPLQP